MKRSHYMYLKDLVHLTPSDNDLVLEGAVSWWNLSSLRSLCWLSEGLLLDLLNAKASIPTLG